MALSMATPPPTGHVGMFIGLMLGMYLLLLLVPYFEPRKQNLAESIGFLHLVKNFLLGFFLLLFTAVTLLALGIYDLDIPRVISIGIGGMFIAFGLYMGRIKSNFFMGIRTPWTLSSDEIWHKTHLLGSKLFALSGIGFVLGPVLSPPLNFLLPISLLLLAAVVPVLYSFWLYQKH